MRKMKPPGRRKVKREEPPDPAQKGHERTREQPAAAERTDEREGAEPAVDAGGPSREEVISNVTQPVTNQDEQDKITNADGNDIPVANK